MQHPSTAYLVDAVSAPSLDSVVGLSSALDLVERGLGVEGFFVEDVDPAHIVGLAGLELLRRIFA